MNRRSSYGCGDDECRECSPDVVDDETEDDDRYVPRYPNMPDYDDGWPGPWNEDLFRGGDR